MTELADRTINVTDRDARNLTARGWVQGYNAQAVVTAEQIVIGAISTESLDNPKPAADAARRRGRSARPPV